MKILAILVLALVLVGCSHTKTVVSQNITIMTPERPRAIECPSVKVARSEDTYVMDQTSHSNLKFCLGDTIRYQDQSNNLFTYYEGVLTALPSTK